MPPKNGKEQPKTLTKSSSTSSIDSDKTIQGPSRSGSTTPTNVSLNSDEEDDRSGAQAPMPPIDEDNQDEQMEAAAPPGNQSPTPTASNDAAGGKVTTLRDRLGP